jgi:hypothetical protein
VRASKAGGNRPRFAAIARWSLPVAAAMALPSCETTKRPCVAQSGLDRLTIITEPGTNGGLATEIDLVFITSKKTYEALQQMNARDYFAQRERMVRDFPTGLKIRSFGLEQTQRQIDYRTEPPCHLVGTLLFVHYNNDRPNRISVGKAKAGRLVLGPDDFTWRPK